MKSPKTKKVVRAWSERRMSRMEVEMRSSRLWLDITPIWEFFIEVYRPTKKSAGKVGKRV